MVVPRSDQQPRLLFSMGYNRNTKGESVSLMRNIGTKWTMECHFLLQRSETLKPKRKGDEHTEESDGLGVQMTVGSN